VIRLQKVMADRGVASRRAAEEMITEGRVRVNGDLITTLGTRVLEDAHIEASGEPLSSMPLSDDELKSTDCVIIVTDHSEIDYKRVCSLAPLIVDTRNALNGELRSASKARVIRL